MSVSFLYSEHDFNAAIFGLALSFALLVCAIRLSRGGGDGFSEMGIFVVIKLAEGCSLAAALIALLAIVDSAVASRFAAHHAYALPALLAGIVTSIDLLLDD
jgi:hypothetical protein